MGKVKFLVFLLVLSSCQNQDHYCVNNKVYFKSGNVLIESAQWASRRCETVVEHKEYKCK